MVQSLLIEHRFISLSPNLSHVNIAVLLNNITANTYFDGDVLCGELSFDNISKIRYIKAFVFENHIDGTLYANCENIIEKSIEGRYTSFGIYSSNKDIESISFKLTDYSINKLMSLS